MTEPTPTNPAGLLPCPFCGGPVNHVKSMAKSFDPNKTAYEYLHSCAMVSLSCQFGEWQSNWEENQNKFIAAWNTRAHPTPPEGGMSAEESFEGIWDYLLSHCSTFLHHEAKGKFKEAAHCKKMALFLMKRRDAQLSQAKGEGCDCCTCDSGPEKTEQSHGPDYWCVSKCPICAKQFGNGRGCYSHVLNFHKLSVTDARKAMIAAAPQASDEVV